MVLAGFPPEPAGRATLSPQSGTNEAVSICNQAVSVCQAGPELCPNSSRIFKGFRGSCYSGNPFGNPSRKGPQRVPVIEQIRRVA